MKYIQPFMVTLSFLGVLLLPGFALADPLPPPSITNATLNNKPLNNELLNGLPTNIRLTFKGPYGVPASMNFSYTDKTYTFLAKVEIPFNTIQFTAEGLVQNSLLKPLKYRDIRKNNIYAYADYNYDKREITYGKGKSKHTATIEEPSQDIFTLAWQMAINQGNIDGTIQTTNGKKIYKREPFQKQGTLSLYVNKKKYTAQHFITGSGDDRVEVGLISDLYFIPALIAFYDKGKRYELKLTEVHFTP